MTVNREAFTAVVGLITEFPELHNPRSWESDPEDTGHCGTTRCIAGWATWWKAREMGLLSKKRQFTDEEIRRAVAEEMGLDHPHHHYSDIGQAVLGLDRYEAMDLFDDMNDTRALARAQSYAAHGHDLTDEELASFG